MESLSPVNGMAITPEIKDAVEHKFVCNPLVISVKSSHFVKGVKEATAVFTIDSHKNAGAGAATVELVGRTAELGQLQDQWQMLQMGQGQAVVVTGGAGIGKTALTSAFAQTVRAEESKPVVMLIKASEQRKSSPLYTAAQVLKRWASDELGERAQGGVRSRTPGWRTRRTRCRRRCWRCWASTARTERSRTLSPRKR